MYKYLLLIIIPIFFVYKNLFLDNHGSYGDAPFFYIDALKSLLSEPLVWVTRGVNFGGINQLLWISPLMILYGILAKFLFLDSQTITKAIFYIPAIAISVIGPLLLTKYLRYSKTVSFFTVMFYSLNTYFILLIDGGQVGIALAYGIFPLSLLFVRKLVNDPNISNFFLAYTFGILLTITDPRIYMVLILLLFLWAILERKSLKNLLILQIPVILSNLYWLYPMIKINSIDINHGVLDLQTSSLINSLLLIAPHWPDNTFGKIIPPPFYFFVVPILLFGSFWFKEKNETQNKNEIKIIATIFLIFAFLAKGTTAPFGELYNFIVTKVPFGLAFRDSSKFFIPLILLGGIMMGKTIDKLKNYKFINVFSYIYILILISPVILGKLNFNLSNRIVSNDFEKTYLRLKNDNSSFKTLWFPEKNPASYETNSNPGIDARDLVKINTFASINKSEDPYNFLNDFNFPDKLAKLGIKYLFLNGDSRNLNPNKNEIKDWETITKLVSNNSNLRKLDWGTSFPVFEISNALPKFYKVDTLVGVIGPSLDIEVPAIYFEDGKLNPRLLEGKDPKSVKLFFNGKDSLDLTMSFLQKFFIGTRDAYTNEFAYYPHSNYLKAKYELLIRGHKYDDFDYGLGIAFSTQREEIIKFKLKVPQDGDYVLVIRKIDEDDNFKWYVINNNISIKKGNFDYEFKNDNEFNVLNIVALIPKKDFDDAEKLSQIFVKHFGITETITDKKYVWDSVEIQNEGTSKYKFIPKETGFWIILNESYNSLWLLRKGVENFNSVPVNSEVNGFYFESKWNDLYIEFDGQRYFRWGLYYSLVSLLGTLIILLYKYKVQSKDHEKIN